MVSERINRTYFYYSSAAFSTLLLPSSISLFLPTIPFLTHTKKVFLSSPSTLVCRHFSSQSYWFVLSSTLWQLMRVCDHKYWIMHQLLQTSLSPSRCILVTLVSPWLSPFLFDLVKHTHAMHIGITRFSLVVSTCLQSCRRTCCFSSPLAEFDRRRVLIFCFCSLIVYCKNKKRKKREGI